MRPTACIRVNLLRARSPVIPKITSRSATPLRLSAVIPHLVSFSSPAGSRTACRGRLTSNQAERDAHAALAVRRGGRGLPLGMPDAMECLARLAADADSHREAARLFGAAEAMRQRSGEVRFQIYQAGYEASVATVQNALGNQDFESAWAEGAALSTGEAIAYARRGRGERKRPTIGWGSLTPTERDVVRLVQEGLSNKDIAARLLDIPQKTALST